MNVNSQKFLVLGVSKSGYACADYLLNVGAICYLYEEKRNDKIIESVGKLVNRGAIFVEKEEIIQVVNYIDVVVISPGVPINHEVAIMAKEHNKRIIGEFEFGYQNLLPLFIAVTGTNGKTTTVSLIDSILKENNINTNFVGNSGVPLSSELNNIDSESVCVAEVSSFQLESINMFCPHIACVTNVAPDHLERHYTMENYIYLKKRIFKNQRESEYTVLNYDDDIVREFASETRGKVTYVSLKDKVNGAYRENGRLYYNGKYIIDETQLPLRGEHNIYDVLFAICCAELMCVPTEITVRALRQFKGVKHRIELVAEKGGIKFYNDSKATNTASTINAVDSMESPCVLILGGSEKGENYQLLFEKILTSKIKHTVITGASKNNMISAAERVGYKNYSAIDNFEFAVKFATVIAESGESVLLSPACASFDKFSSFEERGDAFCRIINQF